MFKIDAKDLGYLCLLSRPSALLVLYFGICESVARWVRVNLQLVWVRVTASVSVSGLYGSTLDSRRTCISDSVGIRISFFKHVLQDSAGTNQPLERRSSYGRKRHESAANRDT